MRSVEAVAVVEPDRERVVAELAVERAVDLPRDASREAALDRELSRVENADPARPRTPVARFLLREEEEQREPGPDPVAHPLDDT
jgi:hypothetical protein